MNEQIILLHHVNGFGDGGDDDDDDDDDGNSSRHRQASTYAYT